MFSTLDAKDFEKRRYPKTEYAKIEGVVPKSEEIDSVRLFLYNENTASQWSINITGMIIFTAKVKNGRYTFDIPVTEKPKYFSIYKNETIWPDKKGMLIHLHLIEKGDNILIDHSTQNPVFSGIGSVKHTLEGLYSNGDESMFEFDNSILSNKFKHSKSELEQYNIRCENMFTKTERLLQLLNNKKEEISEKSYQMIYCDMIGSCQYPIIEITSKLTNNIFKIAQSDKDAIELQFKRIERKLIRSSFSDSVTSSSIFYVRYFLNLLMLQKSLNNDTSNLIRYIVKSTENNMLRDKLLISTFGFSYKRNGNLTPFAADHMCNPSLKNDLLNFHNKQKNSHIFPLNFQLIDKNNKEINLSKFKGKVLFLDFWFVGCVPCADYYKRVVSLAESYFADSKDVVFITVCTEKDYERWLSAVNSKIYTSEKAINLFTGSQRNNHPLIKYLNIVSAPTPMLIDKNFKIFSRDEMILGRGGDANVLIDAIKECIVN